MLTTGAGSIQTGAGVTVSVGVGNKVTVIEDIAVGKIPPTGGTTAVGVGGTDVTVGSGVCVYVTVGVMVGAAVAVGTGVTVGAGVRVGVELGIGEGVVVGEDLALQILPL